MYSWHLVGQTVISLVFMMLLWAVNGFRILSTCANAFLVWPFIQFSFSCLQCWFQEMLSLLAALWKSAFSLLAFSHLHAVLAAFLCLAMLMISPESHLCFPPQLLVWYVNDGQLTFLSGIFSAVSSSSNLVFTSIHGKDFGDVKWFKINFHGKLNQMLACIIPLPRFRAASDVWFCLAANFCIEITHYVNNIFFGHLLQSFLIVA